PLVPPRSTGIAASSLPPPCPRDRLVSDFAMNEQARRSSPPNRLRYPTDQQFASGFSPPCLGATQLPSATELWHTPTRTFTVLMWRPHGRTHSREKGNPCSPPPLDSHFRGSDGLYSVRRPQLS